MNDYHGLPGVIGRVITEHKPGITHDSAGYLVRMAENGAIEIYRTVDRAKSRDQLEDRGDFVAEMYDHVVSGVDAGYIAPPEDGWPDEIDELADDIWSGWG
jgi:hypothetical protein